jgi:anti-sigma B factor antagonist
MSGRAISLVRHESGASIVTVRGEHDLSTADELRDALNEALEAPAMIVDLSETAFIDSAVLGVLIASHRAAVEAGHRWSLVVGRGAGAAVRRILELTGLDVMMPLYDSMDEALAAGAASGSGMPG